MSKLIPKRCQSTLHDAEMALVAIIGRGWGKGIPDDQRDWWLRETRTFLRRHDARVAARLKRDSDGLNIDTPRGLPFPEDDDEEP